jgi:hypothetical protein
MSGSSIALASLAISFHAGGRNVHARDVAAARQKKSRGQIGRVIIPDDRSDRRRACSYLPANMLENSL